MGIDFGIELAQAKRRLRKDVGTCRAWLQRVWGTITAHHLLCICFTTPPTVAFWVVGGYYNFAEHGGIYKTKACHRIPAFLIRTAFPSGLVMRIPEELIGQDAIDSVQLGDDCYPVALGQNKFKPLACEAAHIIAKCSPDLEFG